MTEPPLHCAFCERPLRADDLFCSRCGRPTPVNADPDATVLMESEGTDASSLGADDEVTIRDDQPRPAAPTAAASFKARFQHLLGGEFQLLTLLGEGGFARVYKALDRRLDRIVAIKVIQPELVGEELFVQSFRKEGIALAKLRHPGIVPIYDIRERGGLIYYVMPFVEGSTIEQRMAQGRIPPYETKRILSELADVLAAAHRAHMVHLDIKPDNVFLEGDLQKVLLVDFGIAMAVKRKVPDASGGPIVGTPSYMSPEQAQGLPEIDFRSDIYSVGALGYCMLAGRPPFSGRDARAILRKHIEQPPVPLRDVNPTIPKEFADVIMKCLEKSPWERFATAKQLEAALEAVTFRATREVTAPPEASAGVHRTVAVLIAAAALLVGLVIGQLIG
jgi:eukaryotic-like serine/threonine-protein kinase